MYSGGENRDGVKVSANGSAPIAPLLSRITRKRTKNAHIISAFEFSSNINSFFLCRHRSSIYIAPPSTCTYLIQKNNYFVRSVLARYLLPVWHGDSVDDIYLSIHQTSTCAYHWLANRKGSLRLSPPAFEFRHARSIPASDICIIFLLLTPVILASCHCSFLTLSPDGT